jgi:signal transduction histidine kinase
VDVAERKKFLGIITRETERLTRLINQVLDLAKIESGRAEWHVSRVDVNEVVADTLAGMSQVFKEKGIAVVATLPDRVSAVRADLDRLIQVLLNLLSNAVKFCEPATGRIEVAVSEYAGHVRIDVRDNGPGISPEDQRVVFDKFRQVGDTLTNKPPGTGLGLHISRQIVEHFGGRMWVESRPGEGAAFSFTLPVELARAEAQPASAPA